MCHEQAFDNHVHWQTMYLGNQMLNWHRECVVNVVSNMVKL